MTCNHLLTQCPIALFAILTCLRYNIIMIESLKQKYNQITLLDKYILRQIIEMFIMGVCVFTSIIFASDTFITLIKQISMFGIPFKVALMMIILNLPSVIVMTIPMGVLLATVMTLNRLSLASEITVMRACGIGLNRIAKPIFIFAIVMSVFSFVINESIVPIMTKQSKDLALWALGQKNIPEGKQNFVFKETGEQGKLKRLFYVGYCEDKVLYNITVLDTSDDETIQVLQADEGKTSPEGWEFEKGAVYTVGDKGKILNTTLFDHSVVKFGVDLSKELKLGDKVVFHGFQNKDYINSMLKESSIYVMTSHTESFGIVLLEAMSYGIPCLSYTSAQGANEIIKDNETGYLIENRCEDEMINKISLLIEDEMLRKQLGKNAKEESKNYSSDVILEKWSKLINKRK